MAKEKVEAHKVEEPKEEKAPKVEMKTAEPTGILVVCKNGTKRLYRYASHGKHWQVLAKQYAQNKKACDGELYKQ